MCMLQHDPYSLPRVRPAGENPSPLGRRTLHCADIMPPEMLLGFAGLRGEQVDQAEPPGRSGLIVLHARLPALLLMLEPGAHCGAKEM